MKPCNPDEHDWNEPGTIPAGPPGVIEWIQMCAKCGDVLPLWTGKSGYTPEAERQRLMEIEQVFAEAAALRDELEALRELEKCENEFCPEDPGACAEYRQIVDDRLYKLDKPARQQMKSNSEIRRLAHQDPAKLAEELVAARAEIEALRELESAARKLHDGHGFAPSLIKDALSKLDKLRGDNRTNS